MNNKNVVCLVFFVSIVGCISQSKGAYFCNEFTNKFIRFRINEEYKLLSNPDLKNNVNIILTFQNINFRGYQEIDFGTRIADLYTNGLKHSNNEFALMVFKGLKDDPSIDSIYQINYSSFNEINFVTFAISKKQMGHNLWFKSIHFNLVDSFALLVETTDFEAANNFELVRSKHLDLLKSIEFGVCVK